jgi:DNA transformation protein
VANQRSPGGTSELVAHLLDLLRPFATVQARRMFGGYGIYREGLMFGLVADDVFYLKVDGGSRPVYQARGLPPFSYLRGGKRVEITSFHQAPPEALEDPELLLEWAGQAFQAALAAANKPR